ncbi:hypothetical protein pipiens_016275 [Culex pipiens pipiens]|uniref:F-box domain-containing protein n=1 Tax=Culex pipiens pipiens TaxID=38569 RepID=A0ABD1CLY9_CULPP
MATVSALVRRMTLSEPEFHLPPELWELIFAHLAGKRVLVMRLVCHRWKTIVDRKRSLSAESHSTIFGGISLISASTPDLCEIAENLPDLKQLSVVVECQEMLEPSFLSNMKLLKILVLRSFYVFQPLNFGPLKCPYLVELKLQQFHLVANSLTFLASSKNLQKLSLNTCVLESLLELFTMLNFDVSTFQLTTNLESLHLNYCENLTHEMVNWLATSSCRMSEVRLDHMFQVNDATIQNLCLKLPRLKKLTLINCSVTAASAEYIVNHAHSMDYLDLVGCLEFHQAMVRLLKGHQ